MKLRILPSVGADHLSSRASASKHFWLSSGELSTSSENEAVVPSVGLIGGCAPVFLSATGRAAAVVEN
jgi:hypothetical protein